MDRPIILEAKDLSVSFKEGKQEIPVVNSIRFSLREGEILGVVGESGCGKSVTSLALMGLLAKRSASVTGEILFRGQDLTAYSESDWRKIRGNEISMIFQEPMTSLNPLFKIGDQLIEAIRVHSKVSKKEAKEQAVKMLSVVGLARPEELLKEFPHQLSGGMRQRVMIAMAMILSPDILIADEPTTALDVTIQAQILSLMKEINEKMNASILFITHDLGVVAQTCQRVMVMYAGEIVEEGDLEAIFQSPEHPYTKGLLKSIPDLHHKKEKLYSITGQVPKPGSIQGGCKFAPRCEFAHDRCRKESPVLTKVKKHQSASCFLVEEGEPVGEGAAIKN
ncbi:ABC transporter ATP-binding protein [Metabacillus sp. RGM 3146]|uniref:ABC transporter ATP-binding protein n=1 Tax=Metabacillus sp. RGM 3146 TaxID=3401092 RepID=UPI003B991440